MRLWPTLSASRGSTTAAAKYQAAGPIEVGDQLADGASQQWQADKQQGKQQQGRPVGLVHRDGLSRRGLWVWCLRRADAGTEQGSARQHDELGEQAGLPPEGGRGGDHDPLIARRLAELAAHGEHRIGDHHQRQQLEAVQGGIEPDVVAELAQTDGGGQQQQEGGR